MNLRRKIALATMLGLTTFVVIIAVIRGAGAILPGGEPDSIWLYFWQTMEAAVAIITVSLTGVRSLFHTDDSGAGPSNYNRRSALVGNRHVATVRSMGSKEHFDEDEESRILRDAAGGVAKDYPSGPFRLGSRSGTVTMSRSTWGSNDEELADMPPALLKDSGIRVTHDIHVQSGPPGMAVGTQRDSGSLRPN